MAYTTLMVHFDLDQSNEARLKIAGDLAGRFDASVVGIAACARPVPFYLAGGSINNSTAHRLMEPERAKLEKRFHAAEKQFRIALAGRTKHLEWRSALEQPTTYVVEQCRAADLIIVGASRDKGRLDPLRELIPYELVISAGRPVLVMPPEIEALKANHIIIGWKDTREARRAVFDALPFLRLSEKAIVVKIDEDKDPTAARKQVDDVVAWLDRQGVKASGTVQPSVGKTADTLDTLARQEEADLIIAGAYGHSRLRQWVLGGVTHDLLARAPRCLLLAH